MLKSDIQYCISFYLEDCFARGQSQRTIDEKRYSLRRFSRWCALSGITDVDQIDKFALEDYRRYLRTFRQRASSRPLDIATVRNLMTAVKVFLRRLYFFEIIKSNPGEHWELPKVPRRLPKGFLTVTEIEKILSLTILYGEKGIRDRAVMETYYATGIRRMELAKLRTADLDFQKRLLTVQYGKGDHERRVPIAARACGWIEYYLIHVRPKLATLESGISLFLANDGLAFRPSQLTLIASKYVKKAGIKKRGACNLFRHSTATLMHENGADIRYVQEMLGHADISTTQVYTHVTINKLRQIYQSTHPAATSESDLSSISDR